MTLEIPCGPEDTVSRLAFNPSSSRLAVSSWDSRVKIYDLLENRLIADYSHTGPVLDCCWLDDDRIVSVGVDRKINLFSALEPGTLPVVIGVHSDTIKCIAWLPTLHILITASWDKSVCFWTQSDQASGWKQVKQLVLEERPHAMDASFASCKLVIACDNRAIVVVEGEPANYLPTVRIAQYRESSLKHPTRNIAIFPDGLGWCTSSTEGRVSIDYFDLEMNISKRYAFKCHRQTKDGIDYVYPVNALATHPKWSSFATGGSDGQVSIWNRDAKRRLKALPSFPTTISQLAFSPDGKMLAVAASYVWDQGDLPAQTHNVFVYPVYESDVNPQSKPAATAE